MNGKIISWSVMGVIIYILAIYYFTTKPIVLKDEVVSVVKSGECYSFKIDTWISSECYETYDVARDNMNGFIEFRKKERDYENRVWIEY